MFRITDKDIATRARNGVLSLGHGAVETPVFMPVGTNATVKAIRPDDLDEIGYRMILANAYHLYLRPGIDVIDKARGLHNFMAWRFNILTDSGGFQVFSLAPYRKVEEEGIVFRSHIDGLSHRLSPEAVVDNQLVLGSDVIMPLDVCTASGVSRDEAREALERTSRWALRSKSRWTEEDPSARQLLFGIVQGNLFEDLRELSSSQIAEIGFPGYAIGGLSVGEEPSRFREILSHTASLLPEDAPHYLMGVGTPEYILEGVERGIDMFDCVYPTRIARNAMAFTRKGNLSLKTNAMRLDQNPIDSACSCSVCQKYTRSYIRHLFKSKEILAAMLTTYHNLHFLRFMMADIREAIASGSFAEYKGATLGHYHSEHPA